MAAPRAVQVRVLGKLGAGGRQQARQLHMTGPATYASALLTTERPAVNLPRDITGLRAEAKRRKMDATGSIHDLIGRLSADDLTHSRAFSTTLNQSKRPTSDSSAHSAAVRHFNTSRALKAVNDSSTIDFAFLPDFDRDSAETAPIRVPLLPTNFFPPRTGAHAREGEETVSLPHPQSKDIPHDCEKTDARNAQVMRPQINTVSEDSAVSQLSDIHDNGAMNIDFHAVADKVAAAADKFKHVPVAEQATMIKTLWNGFVDDIVGPKKPSAATT
ncbi:hypothetical protein LTR66_013456 [Elasticomyces elasticus]|nr:hypothetical protein LTR66_013456 [Elasticomyces elasticus]